MKLTASREDLLAPLQSVIGVVGRRQTMPVLANVLLAARDNKLNVTGTDLEVELVASTKASVQQGGDLTVGQRPVQLRNVRIDLREMGTLEIGMTRRPSNPPSRCI